LVLSSGAGSAGTYVFSANGLYDPDITSTGHQPMPFDQMMLSFEHYCVHKAKIIATFRNVSVSAVYPVDVAISLNAGTSAVSNYQTLVENGLLERMKLNCNNAGVSNSIGTLTRVIDISRFGDVPSLLSNPDYKGTISSNPAEQSYFHISCWNPLDTTVVSASVEVVIEYDATFFEPRKNSISLNTQLRRLILAEDSVRKTECKAR
jgi:hypothetical protein